MGKNEAANQDCIQGGCRSMAEGRRRRSHSKPEGVGQVASKGPDHKASFHQDTIKKYVAEVLTRHKSLDEKVLEAMRSAASKGQAKAILRDYLRSS